MLTHSYPVKCEGQKYRSPRKPTKACTEFQFNSEIKGTTMSKLKCPECGETEKIWDADCDCGGDEDCDYCQGTEYVDGVLSCGTCGLETSDCDFELIE